MFAFSALIFAFFCVQFAFGIPAPSKLTSTTSSASVHLSTRGSTSARYVVYSDKAATAIPDPKDIEGFNILVLAFLLGSGKGTDVAKAWEMLGETDRHRKLQQYEKAGIKIMVSAFGATEAPTGLDPTKVANSMADWVIKYKVHGIDVDYEDLTAMGGGSKRCVEWIIKFTEALRRRLPQGKYLISHAPLAPWFAKKGGPYLKVNRRVGNLIDWYNVQFYNQGKTVYNTCDRLITKMNDQNPALFEIVANGVPMEKLVVGKPAVEADAVSGYIPPADLGKCLARAKQKHGYGSGAMTWQYHAGGRTLDWIKKVRGRK